MRQTLFEQASAVQIGTVEFVSPDEIKIAVDVEAPDLVALNTGGPRPFPRVNGYLLIPVDQRFLVGQVVWITVERSPFPKRRGMQDFGLVDLPYPLRRISLNPLGILSARRDGKGLVFTRGSDVLPSVGAPALLPTDEHLRAIVESGEKKRVPIGTSPVANNATVYVDPDRLFGRHLAVLGNTGSGKSCSVAGLIRWSIEAAKQESDPLLPPNARFIILDPNGEYSSAFPKDDPTIAARIFRVNAEPGEESLKVPLWFWNSAEWCAFTHASTKTQRPMLKRALREVKAGRTKVGEAIEEKKLLLRRKLSSMRLALKDQLESNQIKTKAGTVGNMLEAYMTDLENWTPDYPDIPLQEIRDAITSALEQRRKPGRDKQSVYYVAFAEVEIERIVSCVEQALERLGGIIYQEGPDEDVPLPFKGADLADHLETLAERENASQYLEFLVARIRTFLADPRIKPIIAGTEDITLEQWLSNYIGTDNDANSPCVSIIDLSLVPTDVIHVVTAVIARMVFEALQRYVILNQAVLPTVLVLEEAHTFVKRYKEDDEYWDTAAVCCQTVERIAREGRKFGLGLVLSSQRPSEISPTILSQCNTFLLHRISNDRDQELVHRLVPDNLRGLLRELPLLPPQQAILLGWASELPVLVKMRELNEFQRPRSNDPDFWDVWTGKNEKGEAVRREIAWKTVAESWRQGSTERGNALS